MIIDAQFWLLEVPSTARARNVKAPSAMRRLK